MFRSRYIRWAAYGAGGLVVLIGLSLAGIHTPAAKRFALRQIAAILRDQSIVFDASLLDYNLFNLRFELWNVKAQSRQTPDLPPLFSAAHLSAKLNLAKLIGGAVYIEDAAIQNPQIHLVLTADGRDNIPHPPKKASPTPSTDYLVRRLLISGGAVRVEEQKQQAAVFLPLDQIAVDGEALTRNHRVRLLGMDGGQITLASRSLPVRGLNADVVVERNAVQVQSLRMGFGDSSLAVSGAVNDLDNPSLDLKANADLALAPLLEFAEMSPMARGNLQLVLGVNGPVAKLTATARVDGANLEVDRFPGVTLSADAAYEAASSRVRLASLAVTAPWGRVRGLGDVALSGPGESTAQITTEDFDLDRLSTILRLPVRIASRAAAKVDARWPGLRYQEASAEATVQLKAQRATPSKDVAPVDATVRASARGNRVILRIDELRSLGAMASGEVTLVERRSLGGDLNVNAQRLSVAIAAAEAFLGREPGSLLGTPAEGSLASTVKLAGTASAPQAAVTAAIPDLSVGTLQGVAVTAAATYSTDRLAIDDASVNWKNQALRASGTVGLGKQQNLQIAVRSNDLSIPAILAGLDHGDLPLAGDLSLGADVTGTVDAPSASVTLTGSGIAAYGEILGSLSARAQLQGRQVEVGELRLGAVSASASYNLDSKQYRAQARAQNFRLASLTLPDGTAVRGDVDLDAAGQGTVDSPAGELKLTADNIQMGDQQFGRAEVTLKAANRQVELEASAPKFHATATAKAGIDEPYPATVQVRLAQFDLKQLPVKLQPPLEGTVSAVIDASGDLKDYQQGKAQAEVSNLDVKYNGEAIRTEGPLTAHYAAGTLTLDKAVIVAADSRVEASGSLPLEASAGEGAIHLNARFNLPGMARFAPPEMKMALAGTATIDGNIRGTLQRIDPALAISLENASLAFEGLSPAVTNATLRGQVRDGALEIQTASAKWGQASFAASGTVPFALLPADLPVEMPRRQGPAKFAAELTGLNLAAVPGVPANVSGSASARIEAEAATPDLNAVKAILTLPELKATIDTFPVAQDQPSEITLESGVVRVKHLRLTGPSTELQLSGTAEIAGQQALDLHLDGNLDASVAAAFADGLRTRGATEIHAAVSGTVKEPQAKGYVQVADGQFSMQDPRVGIEGLNLRVDLEGMRATLSKLEGQVNGGALGGQGSIAFRDGKLQDADLSVRADDLYMDFPAGLKTVSDVRLQLKSVAERLTLSGSVLIKEGGFTDDLNFDKGILAAATAPRSLGLTERRNPILDAMRLNVSVATQDPLVVQNNLAKAEINLQLVVLGSPYEPGLAGRLTIEEGSLLTLQERKYEVTRGVITFTSERRIEPSLDIEATTSVTSFEITLRISGPPGDTKTELTSNPPLAEPDIMAMLVTGKTLDEIRGQELQVAQNQMLSYLTGRLGGTIGKQIENATGLSRVRVEPNLIAAEANPGARLTVGQDITRQLNLVYSMDLVNSTDQIYIAEYDLTKRFVTRGVRQSDGSYRFDFRHDVRFGGGPQPESHKRVDRRIGLLSISGKPYFTEEKVRDTLKVGPGQRYDFFKLRKGLDRVTRLYTKADLLESNVRLKRDQKDSVVDLNLKIDPGPQLEFVFEGASVPGGVAKEIRRVWYSGVFDTQRIEDAVGVLREWLVGDSYLTPEIKPEITNPSAGRKHVLFDIQRGPRFAGVEWVFDGAKGLTARRLRDVIESQKLATEVYTKPPRVTELLAQFYHEMGYLDAAVGKPRYELNKETRTGKVVFAVTEGPLYRVGEARFSGNHALTAVELAEAVPLPRGEGYRPILRENAIQRLREAYYSRGYNDAETDVELEQLPERALVNMVFRITENGRGVVEDIVIEGNRATSEKMIRSQLDFKPGDPVNLQKISSSRRKLYNTGAYAVVDIAREDPRPKADDPKAGDADTPVRLRVKVREIQPFEIRYGGFYDTERGPGGIVDVSDTNTLGSARVLGFRARYDSQLQEARVYFSQPLLSRFPVKTTASPYVRREINPDTPDATGFNVDRIGFAAQQEFSLGRKMIVNYGYKIERTRTYDTGPDPIFDVPLRLAFLTTTFSRDTRDDILDASKGSFLSHALEYSPQALGSQVSFLKYSGQYFRYFPLQKPRVVLFTNKVLRPRLIYATGVRVGLARGLAGQEVPLSERFFAGGGTTIRGFEQNSVGTGTTVGTQLGGNALMVLNNELRFPLVSIFDGAGFVDLGNVYPKVSDFSLTDIRKAAGLGLRVRTPWFLLRMDYGFKLDRRPGESMGRFFFSIGQAF